jgi:biopolymer transport protein ExbD
MNTRASAPSEYFGFLWKRYRTARRPVRGPLDAVPLVNVILLVFLFFMVNFSFVRQPGLLLELPAAPFAAGSTYWDLSIAVVQDGMIFIKDQKVTLEQLREECARAVGRNPDLTLLIEADSRVSHGSLVALYNLARGAGVQHVVLATQPRGLEGMEYELPPARAGAP